MTERPVHHHHPALTATAVLVGVEAAALAGCAAVLAVELAVSTPSYVGAAVSALALALVGASALALVTRGLLRARRWSRSPALLTQLFGVPVAVGLLQSGRWLLGVPLLLVAVAAAVLVLSPPVGAALERS